MFSLSTTQHRFRLSSALTSLVDLLLPFDYGAHVPDFPILPVPAPLPSPTIPLLRVVFTVCASHYLPPSLTLHEKVRSRRCSTLAHAAGHRHITDESEDYSGKKVSRTIAR